MAPRPHFVSRSSGPRRFLAVVILAAVLAISAGVLYLFVRATPSAVGLDGEQPTASTRPSSGGTGGAADELSGTWTVDASVGSFEDYSSSFVGYRVQEELAGIGAATAVGRTPDVTGTLVVDEASITSVTVEANLTTLKSDNDLRDGQLARQGLETSTYPTASFVLIEPIQLDQLPGEGEALSATASGELTIHGVTRTVQIPVDAERNGSVVTVVGSIEIVFSDYGMTSPQSMAVLSVDDSGIMEFQLHFTK